MTTANDAISLFRSYVPAWKYALGVHDFANKTTDCMGMVDYWGQQLGIADKLGPQLPWNVSYFVTHTSYSHIGPGGEIHPGDILVLGDPTSTDVRLKYAHIGVATTPGNYISMYNYGINVVEKPIDHSPTMQHVLTFWTGFTQGVKVLGTATKFVAVEPFRLVGSSTGKGTPVTTTLEVPLTMLPAGVVAIAGNITVTKATMDGWAEIGTGVAVTTSSVNFVANQPPVANFFIAPVDPAGGLTVTVGGNKPGTAEVLVDVTGYFEV